MTDDNWFPRLTPPDDRLPGPEGLLRKPEELTDEQFDLLAAAWAENAIAADSLSDMEAAIAALPSRLMRAESFRSVKLTPYNDRWRGRDKLLRQSLSTLILRQSPATLLIRRYLVPTLLAAAAVVAIIILWPSAARQSTGTLPGKLPEVAVLTEALIPAPSPVIIPGERGEAADGAIADLNAVMPLSVADTENTKAERPVAATENTEATRPIRDTETAADTRPSRDNETTTVASRVQVIETTEGVKPIRVTVNHTAETDLLIADADNTRLSPVEMKNVITSPKQTPLSAEMPAVEKETNWVFRGISALAKAITKEEKSIDGYIIASACVNGINNALGWEMELKQASNQGGEPLAVNFNSSLISVSAPVNKNSP